MARGTRRGLRYAGIAGIVGPVAFTLAWIASSLAQESYSTRREYISGLASETADAAWLMIAGFVIAGVCTAVLGFALHRAVNDGRGRITGPALIVIAGVLTVAAGVLRYDCSPGTATCDLLVDAGEVSWQHTAHEVAALIVFVSLAFAPLAMAFRFRADRRWAGLRAYSAATTPLAIVLLIAFGAELTETWNGVVQRALVTAVFLWIAVTGWWLARLPEEGSEWQER